MGSSIISTLRNSLQNLRDYWKTPSDPNGTIEKIRLDGYHLSGAMALQHFTEHADQLRICLDLIAEENPSKAIDIISGIASEIGGYKTVRGKLNNSPLFMEASHKEVFWKEFGQSTRDALSQAEEPIHNQSGKRAERNYAKTMFLMPDNQRTAFLVEKKEQIGALVANPSSPKTAFSPFFLYFVTPKDNVSQLQLLEAYAPYFATHFKAREQTPHIEIEDAAFIGIAQKIYAAAEMESPAYLKSAHHHIMTSSVQQIFGSAARGDGARAIIGTALSRINMAGITEADPIIVANEGNARLYKFTASPSQQNNQSMHVLCKATPDEIAPLFARASMGDIQMAFNRAQTELTCPVNITEKELETMGKKVGSATLGSLDI